MEGGGCCRSLIDPNGSHVSLVEFGIDKNGRADRTILRYLLSVNKKNGKSERKSEGGQCLRNFTRPRNWRSGTDAAM